MLNRIIWPRRHPVMPFVRKIWISRSSVSLLPVPRMRNITSERFFLVKMSGIPPSCCGAEPIKLFRKQSQDILAAHAIKIPSEIELVE